MSDGMEIIAAIFGAIMLIAVGSVIWSVYHCAVDDVQEDIKDENLNETVETVQWTVKLRNAVLVLVLFLGILGGIAAMFRR